MPRSAGVSVAGASGLLVSALLISGCGSSQARPVVPNVVGMPPAQAMSALTAAGVRNINCGVRTPANPAGARIVSQQPAAGTEVSDDMTVDLMSSNRCD